MVTPTAAAVVALALTASAAPARDEADRPLARPLSMLAGVDDAARSSAAGDPLAMQRLYNAARDLAEALRVTPIPRSCAPLASALSRLARAQVTVAETFDRQRAWRQKVAQAASARDRVEQARSRCRPGPVTASPSVSQLVEPGAGEAFFGDVRGRAPTGSASAVIVVDGVRTATIDVSPGSFATRMTAAAGQARLKVRYFDSAGKRLSRHVSPGVFLLPRTAARLATGERADAALSNRLAIAARAFDGYAAVSVQRLGTGTVGGWNQDARFPAASTVKLAVLIEAARRHGLAPGSPVLYDVEQAATWSSNLAANRLLATIGGSRVAERRLRLLGARSSTYPGEYRVGTARTGAPRQPPLATQRVTTARDLGIVMRSIHLAAAGHPEGRVATGLSKSTARVLLRALLESEAVGDNGGLVLPFARGAAVAQKSGWISDTRATTAIVYPPGGPVVVSVLAFRQNGLGRVPARALGARLTRLALAKPR